MVPYVAAQSFHIFATLEFAVIGAERVWKQCMQNSFILG